MSTKNIGHGLDFSDLKRIFGNVQDDEGNEGDEAGDENELVFTEFLEVMCASAIYRYPDPFIPIAKRLDTFMGDDMIKPLKGKIKALK